MGPHHYHIIEDVPPAIRAAGENWLMLEPCPNGVECERDDAYDLVRLTKSAMGWR